jgi:hypothetical protein
MRRVLEERSVPSVPVTVRVFIGCRLALARGKPWLAGRWENVPRLESFEWKTKRDAMRTKISDAGYLIPSRRPSPSSLRAKAMSRPISTDASKSPGKRAYQRSSTRICCWKPCPTSSRSCRTNENRGQAARISRRGSTSRLRRPVPACCRSAGSQERQRIVLGSKPNRGCAGESIAGIDEVLDKAASGSRLGP